MSIVGGVLEFLIDRMQIDGDWMVRDEHSFTWWASRLRQRVWATPPRHGEVIEFSTLHIETDLLAGVGADAITWQRLAAVNRFASLSAYVADPEQRTVRIHASVSVTADNYLMARVLAMHALVLQVYDAHAEADALAEVFEARVDASHHPVSGARSTPDEMLGVVDLYQARGQQESPFSSEEIAQLVHLDPRPWTVAANDLRRFDAELPFTDDTVAHLTLDAAETHPSLGTGLLLRLALPMEGDAALVQQLNDSERLEPDAHQLGAWCLEEDATLAFAGFLPSAAYMPTLSRAMAYHLAARCDWARAVLLPSA